jgi:hypothetical protein
VLGSRGIAKVQTLLEAGQVGSRNKSLIAVVELRELDGKFLGPSLFGKEVEDDRYGLWQRREGLDFLEQVFAFEERNFCSEIPNSSTEGFNLRENIRLT